MTAVGLSQNLCAHERRTMQRKETNHLGINPLSLSLVSPPLPLFLWTLLAYSSRKKGNVLPELLLEGP